MCVPYPLRLIQFNHQLFYLRSLPVFLALFAAIRAVPAVATAPAAKPPAPVAAPPTVVISPCKKPSSTCCIPATRIASAISNSCAFIGIYTPDEERIGINEPGNPILSLDSLLILSVYFEEYKLTWSV